MSVIPMAGPARSSAGGRTKNAAEQALKTALRDRSNHGGTTQEIKQTTKVRVLAESWFAEFTGNGNALNTIQLYRDRLDRQVIPSLAASTFTSSRPL